MLLASKLRHGKTLIYRLYIAILLWHFTIQAMTIAINKDYYNDFAMDDNKVCRWNI